MPRPTRRSPAHGRLAGALLATGLLAACSTHDTTDPPRTTTSPPRSTTTTSTTATTTTSATTPPTPEAAVRTAYLAAEHQLAKAFATNDPSGLDLSRIDPNLSAVRRIISQRARLGLVAVYPGGKLPTPVVESVKLTDPTTAVLTSCLIDSGLLVEHRSGRVVDNTESALLLETTLRRTKMQWLIASVRQLDTLSAAAGCDR